ncbi:MAG: HAMP domain-containing protein [Blautia massiliensis (ex Durand et al. 2017)]
MKLRECFTLRTVRKKILMATKLAGIVLVVSYVASTRLPLAPDAAFWVWLCFVTVVVLAVDHWMGRCISRPVDALGAAARKMARLDFSAPCRVQTKDEFGELSRNLNTMAQNLQQALAQLQDANARLEQDVEREKHLLAERKELVDSLSHEMKTPLGVIRAYAEGLQDEPDAARRQKIRRSHRGRDRAHEPPDHDAAGPFGAGKRRRPPAAGAVRLCGTGRNGGGPPAGRRPGRRLCFGV